MWVNVRDSTTNTNQLFRLDFGGGQLGDTISMPNDMVLGSCAWGPSQRSLWLVDVAKNPGVIREYHNRSSNGDDWYFTSTVIRVPAAALRQGVTGLTWVERGEGQTDEICLCCRGGLCAAIYFLDPLDDSISESYFPRCDPRGLAFDGRYLWSVAYNGPSRASILTRRYPHSLTSLNFLYATAAKEPVALAYSGDRLWVLDGSSRRVFYYAAP